MVPSPHHAYLYFDHFEDSKALGPLSKREPFQMSHLTADQIKRIDEEAVILRRKKRMKDFLQSAGDHSALIVMSLIFAFPLYMVLIISFMTGGQAETRSFWPSPFIWSNYVDVFTTVPFLKWTLNTLFISVMGTIGTVVSSVPAAYVLSRLQWRGRHTTFIVILGTMMLPGQVTQIPVYIMFAKLGWIPSFLPMIVPSFFASAFSIFLLRQFFTSIPDGCSEFKLMMRIVIPLAKPAISAIALFAFLGSWNDFFGPLLYLAENPDLYTLGIGLNYFKGDHHTETNLMMTASVLFMLPAIVIFFFSQRVFLEGVTLTGVKG
jgi:multiple sugar transport system permease protein